MGQRGICEMHIQVEETANAKFLPWEWEPVWPLGSRKEAGESGTKGQGRG